MKPVLYLSCLRVLLSLSAWMIDYDADLVSDSSLTHTGVRKRLESCERKEGGLREGEKEMEDRWIDLDTVVHTW